MKDAERSYVFFNGYPVTVGEWIELKVVVRIRIVGEMEYLLYLDSSSDKLRNYRN